MLDKQRISTARLHPAKAAEHRALALQLLGDTFIMWEPIDHGSAGCAMLMRTKKGRNDCPCLAAGV